MKKLLVIFVSISFFLACSSTTVIKSNPPSAMVYLDNVKVGKTPYMYSDMAIAGTSKALTLRLEGYKPFETVIRKEEFEIGPCIGGILFLFPFIWILGYPENYNFDMEPIQSPTMQAPQANIPAQ